MKKIVLSIIALIIFLILFGILFYNFNLKAVSSNSKKIDFMVESGSTYSNVISKLKEEGFIRSELCFKVYIKLNKVNDVQAGTYKLSKNLSVKEIVDIFNKGNTYNPDAIVITFKEGKNMRSIASTIAKNTNNTEDQVYSLLKDQDYLNSLINDYWFITDDILNDEIYYPLEGYLYPNTYEYKNKDVSIQDIFKSMLDEMDKKLKDVKKDIESNKYSTHEILTLASIVELEAGKSKEKADIAGVFYNRLNTNMSLGSDVTTYYAAKVEMSERDLYQEEIDSINPYNTRSSSLTGKLPIGPICNPSIESINAALYPKNNDYLYFVADKNGKTYFTKTYDEHKNIREELIRDGLWYNYE